MCTHDIYVKKIALLIFMNEALSNLKQCTPPPVFLKSTHTK